MILLLDRGARFAETSVREQILRHRIENIDRRVETSTGNARTSTREQDHQPVSKIIDPK
ncbi:hypothetical protein [Lentibacillus sp. Marseille-P4043]|uniref:hypothetical protein n=1 Tax=Lentibacillus sp. Marseille-P4043 TaxID=2040293 RepID=UPI00131A4E23|nr:hypothetical protein [Lentibacillus sp. Marseille-P4043]